MNAAIYFLGQMFLVALTIATVHVGVGILIGMMLLEIHMLRRLLLEQIYSCDITDLDD